MKWMNHFIFTLWKIALFLRGPLSGYIVAVFGKFSSTKSNIEKKLIELGAAVNQKVDASVKVCISTESKLILCLMLLSVIFFLSFNNLPIVLYLKVVVYFLLYNCKLIISVSLKFAVCKGQLVSFSFTI